MNEMLEDLRGRVLRGDVVPPEEYAALVDSLRVARKAAKTKKEAAPSNLPSDLKDLFAEVKTGEKPNG